MFGEKNTVVCVKEAFRPMVSTQLFSLAASFMIIVKLHWSGSMGQNNVKSRKHSMLVSLLS